MQRFFMRHKLFILSAIPVLMAITLTAMLFTMVKTNHLVDQQNEKIGQQTLQIKEQGKQIDSLQQQLDDADNVISDMKAEREKLKGDLDSLEQENATLRDEITALKKKISIAEQQKKVTASSASNDTVLVSSGKTLKVKASAYIANCKEGCTGFTATGLDVRHSTPKIIAVDPRVIPLGTKVEMIVGGKSWGVYTASDTGGAIKGHKIDILMKTEKQCRNFGVQTVELKIVKKPASV